MDSLAKAYLSYSTSYLPLNDNIDDKEWAVRIEGQKICRRFKQQLAFHIRACPLQQFWTKSTQAHPRNKPLKYSNEQIAMINIANTQIAWNKARGCIKRFICKMSVDQLATGKYTKRMGFWNSDKCPRWLQANETTLHVVQCPNI